jgi:hypothetical protein
MPNRTVLIQGTNVGLDVNKLAIYRNEIGETNLVAIVSKKVFMQGYEFEDDDSQEDYVVQCDDPCKTVANLTLREKNYPPTVEITGSTSALAGTSVTLTANGTDPNGDALTYQWNDLSTNQTNTVTSGSEGNVTYSVVATDPLGLWGNDTHTINWFTTTLPPTTQPPTPTTQPPSPFVRIEGPITRQVNDNITLTGEDYNFTGSTWSWTGGAAAGSTTKTITFTETSPGTVTYGVTVNGVDGTYTDTHTVTWSSTPPPSTTTTTAAPTTLPPTTQPPATTTTTTQAPYYWNLILCSSGIGATQRILDDGTWTPGMVFKANENGECYEIDTTKVQSSGGNVVTSAGEHTDCTECLNS